MRGQRAHEPDEDAYEPEPIMGMAEGGKGADHSTHPAHLAGLYLPDLTSETGWDYHHIDPEAPKPRRRVGFGPR